MGGNLFLVAIDGSEASWGALELAARMMAADDSRKCLHLTPLGEPAFHVVSLFERAEGVLVQAQLSPFSWELVHASLGEAKTVAETILLAVVADSCVHDSPGMPSSTWGVRSGNGTR